MSFLSTLRLAVSTCAVDAEARDERSRRFDVDAGSAGFPVAASRLSTRPDPVVAASLPGAERTVAACGVGLDVVCAALVIATGTSAVCAARTEAGRHRRCRAAGSSCLAEVRAIEMIEHGAARTSFLRFGEEVTMQACFADGRPGPFGRVAQRVVRAAGADRPD